MPLDATPPTRPRLSVRNSSASAKAYQAQLVLDRPAHIILLPWGPDEHEEEIRASWEPRGAAGVSRDALDWRGNEPRRVSFELPLQNPADRPHDWLDTAVIWPLQYAAEAVVDAFAEPTRVSLALGTHIYQGSLTSVRVRVTRTTPEGWTRTARLAIELVVNPKEQGYVASR